MLPLTTPPSPSRRPPRCVAFTAAFANICNVARYCSPNLAAGSDVHREPCKGFQTFPNKMGHMTPDRYIGDFNDANMTNVYVLDPAGTCPRS